jgi:hypothetical protein
VFSLHKLTRLYINYRGREEIGERIIFWHARDVHTGDKAHYGDCFKDALRDLLESQPREAPVTHARDF